jgi:Ectodermal ciliogenesis protein
MTDSLLTVDPASRRPSRQLSSLSAIASPRTDGRRGSNVSTDRRPSLFSFGRHKKAVRPKPRLDESVLKAKQEWAAKGLLTIMRKKAAERRRIAFGEATFGGDFKNQDDEPGNEADVEADKSHEKSADETMINGHIISAIPYMPKSLAVICLILNVLIPGSGICIYIYSREICL